VSYARGDSSFGSFSEMRYKTMRPDLLGRPAGGSHGRSSPSNDACGLLSGNQHSELRSSTKRDDKLKPSILVLHKARFVTKNTQTALDVSKLLPNLAELDKVPVLPCLRTRCNKPLRDVDRSATSDRVGPFYPTGQTRHESSYQPMHIASSIVALCDEFKQTRKRCTRGEFRS